MFALDTLCKSVRSPSTVEVEPPLDHDAIALLASAPKPAHGTVSWQLPPSYRSFLTEMGRFSLGWFSPTLGKQHWIVLFDADGIVDASEIVYVPGGVDMGSGAISTNHLVPFAGEPGGEWAFCFDSAAPGPEYPVYYHHQDQPRARLVASGAWDPSADGEPEWPHFNAWFEWLVRAALSGRDPEVIGQPYPKPVLALG